MKQLAKEKGFTIVATIATVAVIVALVLGGWYVWNKNKQTNDASKSGGNTSRTNQNGDQNKQTDPSEGGKYLVIKEWGVRFPLAEKLRGDIYYTPDKYRSDTMVIDSKSFPEGSECLSFGLTRTVDPVSNPTDPDGFNSSSVKQINDYYFSRVTGVIACSDQENVQTNAASIQRQLYDLAELIEAAP